MYTDFLFFIRVYPCQSVAKFIFMAVQNNVTKDFQCQIKK